MTRPLNIAEQEIPADERLRRNIEALLDIYGWTQEQLAERIGKDQPWLSRRMSRKKSAIRWRVHELDAVGHALGYTPAQLLQERFGDDDRRSGHDRRSGVERRVHTFKPRRRRKGDPE